METTAQDTITNQTSKYERYLSEIENLKKIAKKTRPKKYNSFAIINILLTIILFCAIFLIGFFISYFNTKRKIAMESAKYTPKAKINLPTINRCLPADTNAEDENLTKNCLSAMSQQECISIDNYDKQTHSQSPDGVPDCNWK